MRHRFQKELIQINLFALMFFVGGKNQCCYVCLEDSAKLLTLIGKKLTNCLRSFDLYIIENDVTPAYLCDSCRTDINDSCQLLSRVRDARSFWEKLSEKMGVPVKKLAPKPVRRKVAQEEQAREKKEKRQTLTISKFYRCQLCLEKYQNQLGLTIHQWDMHLKNKDHPECCPGCKRVFQDSDHCRRHYHRMHYDAQFVCDMCGKSGMTKPQMKFHLKAYHDTTLKASGLTKDYSSVAKVLVTKPAPVKKEESQDETIEYLEDEGHFDDTTFDPPSPAESVENEPPPKKSKSSDKVSLAGLPPPIITPNGFDSTTDKQCPDCGEWFLPTAETKYYLHYWVNHARQEDNPLVCRECNKEFTAEDLCRRHFFTNHFEQNYTCNLCFKTGMTAVQYKFHIKYCSKKHQEQLQIGAQDQLQVEVKCSHCEDTFPENDKVKLFNHIWRNHVRTPDSPTICSICQKDCFTENNSRAHFYNVHYDKNYICRICDKGGFNKAELKTHRQLVHQQTVEKIKQRREGKSVIPKQQCDFCGEWFRTSTDEWTKHIWTTHGRNNEAPERCEECNKTYPNEFFAKKHFFGHHYRKVEICDECGKGNMTRRELITHLKNHNLTKSRKHIQCPLCTRVLNSEESYKRHMVFHKNQKMDRTHQCTVSTLRTSKDP